MSAALTPLKGQQKALGARRHVPTTVLDTSYISTPGSWTYTAPATGWLHIFAWGAGGSGGADDGGWGLRGAGGGGGGASFARIRIRKGQAVSYTVGAGGAASSTGNVNGTAGGNTVVSLPSGQMVAGGGAGGVIDSSVNAPGGVAYGGSINRSGGDGGMKGSAGFAGAFGGSGGANSGGSGGGGGSAGFSDILGISSPVVPAFSNGGPGVYSATMAAVGPGAGTGYDAGASIAQAKPGGDGRVLFVLMGG